jgi:Tfp pilus assembly protein PilN
MFEINVHREALEQRRKVRQKRIRVLLSGTLYVTVLVLFVGLFSYQMLHLRQSISAKELEMESIQQMLDRYDPQLRSISPEKLLVISQVKGSRIKWGRKLTVLASLLPAQMWLKEIALEDRIVEGVKHEVFLISGATILPEQSEGLTVVLDFLNTLRNNKDFSKGFESVGLLSSKRAVTSEKKELSFEFICIIR